MSDVASTRPPALSTAAATRRVFDLSFGEMLWSRRTIFLALVASAPVALALIFRVVDLRVNGAAVQGDSIFGVAIWPYVRIIVPILGLFYGTSLMADEVEDKTITYLFTRPIPRGAVLLGKYAAYLACVGLVVLPSLMLTYFVTVPLAQVGGTFRALLIDLGVMGAGLAVYGAVFAFVGARFSRPLLSGLVFALGWEPVAMALPGYLRQFTVTYYLQGLMPHALPSDGTLSVIQSLFRQTLPPSTAVFWLSVILVVSLWLAMRTVGRREYVLEQ